MWWQVRPHGGCLGFARHCPCPPAPLLQLGDNKEKVLLMLLFR